MQCRYFFIIGIIYSSKQAALLKAAVCFLFDYLFFYLFFLSEIVNFSCKILLFPLYLKCTLNFGKMYVKSNNVKNEEKKMK